MEKKPVRATSAVEKVGTDAGGFARAVFCAHAQREQPIKRPITATIDNVVRIASMMAVLTLVPDRPPELADRMNVWLACCGEIAANFISLRATHPLMHVVGLLVATIVVIRV